MEEVEPMIVAYLEDFVAGQRFSSFEDELLSKRFLQAAAKSVLMRSSPSDAQQGPRQ